MRSNIPIIFKRFVSRENKYFRYSKKAAARLWQTPAYRDHHGRQAEFSFPSSLLSSHLFSRFLHTVFLSISALILFFFFRPEHLSLSFSFFFYGSTCRTRTRSRTRNTLSVFWSLLFLSSSSSLSLLMPSTPGLSLGFQQWRLHKSRYNAEMDQWEWPRPTQGKRDTVAFVSLHTLPCIHSRCARVYVRG